MVIDKKELFLCQNLMIMIQRIQSAYLFFITLLSLIFIKGSFLNFADKTGAVIKVTFNGIVRVNVGQSPEMIEKLLPLSVLIILIAAVSLITIFIFKNRKIQLWFSLLLMILAAVFVIALFHVSFHIVSKFEAGIIPGFKMFLPVLILIISILAYRGIKKDDQLVKSYERLR
jgi:lipopolysaccharide export LptBFGC system permease protein LptF